MKESKCLPLHTSASGSGASVVAAAVVVSGPNRWEGLASSTAPPHCWCSLCWKSETGACVGLARPLLVVDGEGVGAPNSSSSSSSSAIAKVSPRAGGGGEWEASEAATDTDV